MALLYLQYQSLAVYVDNCGLCILESFLNTSVLKSHPNSLRVCLHLPCLHQCIPIFIIRKQWNKQLQMKKTTRRTQKRAMTTLFCLTSLLFLSISAWSCVPHRELKMVFEKQTTSFCRASVISCGISGLDVPPQISQPSREACGSRQAAFPIIVLNC